MTETIMVEDWPNQAAEYLVRVGRLQVKAKLWDKASATVEKATRLVQVGLCQYHWTDRLQVHTHQTGEEDSVLVHILQCAFVMFCNWRFFFYQACKNVVAASKQLFALGGYCKVSRFCVVERVIVL